VADVGIQAPAAAGLSATQLDAWAILQQTLEQYGFTGANLRALVGWAKGEIIKGSSTNQVTLDLMQTPQFKQRFPAIGVLSNEGIAITPAEYVSMEQSFAQAEKQAGLPANFASYDALIQAKVSPSEYSDRLTQGYLAVANSDQNVVNQFQQYYGVGKNQLAAYFLNPKAQEPLLLKQALAAQIGGAAVESGWHQGSQLSQADSLKLAQQGVTQSQAQQGFAQLAHEQQLTQGMPGQPETYNFTTGNLSQAAVGLDATTEQQLQVRGELEKGMFAQGVGVQSNAQGEQGAGSVQR
jgi:hypothetical protein